MPEKSPRGVLATLFDFSFSSFLATKVIKLLYGLSILVISVLTLGLVVGAFQDSAASGIFGLVVVAPIVFLIGVMYARVLMELMIVLFRISENVQLIADREAEVQ